MFDQISFYVRHSLNDLRANGRRTFFALLCIAAGVAAIVSLQTLVVMISDTLNSNLQVTNRGDIQFQVGSKDNSTALQDQGIKDGILQRTEDNFFGATNTTYSISQEGIQKIKDWLNANYP